MLTLLLLAALAGPARADAVPVFSPTGPDAAAHGAAEGYPVHAIGPRREQRYLVGAFSHADQLGPHREVPAAAVPAPFDRAPDEIGLSYNFRGATHSLADYLERHPVTGLLIVRDRTILFEHYQYGRTDRDRFASQSMAKTVNAMLIGIAVGEGAIRSIDDPASGGVTDACSMRSPGALPTSCHAARARRTAAAATAKRLLAEDLMKDPRAVAARLRTQKRSRSPARKRRRTASAPSTARPALCAAAAPDRRRSPLKRRARWRPASPTR